MTNKKINIAIAEACGWKDLENEDFSAYGVPCFMLMGSNNTGTRLAPPDYLNDLNAMHEAEKTLTQDQMIDYSRHVGKSVTSHLPASRAAWMDFRLIHATASQKAKAFLQTLGKWEE